MGARTIPGLPGGVLVARLRGALRPLARRGAGAFDRLASLPPSARALILLAAAVASVAALTYYSAEAFSRRAVDRRAASEANSLATLTGRLATGDAFNTYLEMLRYAEDPAVRERTTPADVRLAAMRRLLELNTNNLSTLVVADRTGAVATSTDPAIRQVADSAAFQDTRTSLHPGNGDVVVPQPGSRGYIEFAVPLKDSAGSTWGVLLGRGDPAKVWLQTLPAAVDGSRNIVINGEGLMAAGVPDALLGQPWRGQTLDGGGVRTTIDGVASICGLSAVGRGSPIDQGFSIASCLPSSLVESEHQAAFGKQGWITVSGAVLAVVLAGSALYAADRRRRETPGTGPARPEGADLELEPAPAAGSPGERIDAGAGPPPVDLALEPAVLTLAARDVDAVALIDGFERRNERLSEQLREEIRARLLVAGTRAEEAYRRIDPEGGTDDGLHREAMKELEAVRDRALRALEQEMYPAVVRLGLPNALKSLRRDLADAIDLTLEMDPAADAVDEEGERQALDPGLRLVLYRLVLDTARSLAAAGASEALVTLTRKDGALTLSVEAGQVEGADAGEDALATSRIAVEAYGGELAIGGGPEQFDVTARFAA